MKRSAYVIITSAVLVATAHGADVKKEIEQATRKLDDAFAAGDINAIRQGTTTDHIAISSHFQFYSQAEQLRSLDDYKISSYEVSDAKAFPLSDDVVLLTFRADVESTFRGKNMPSKVNVVEAWVKRNGKWLQASYQQTPIADPEE